MLRGNRIKVHIWANSTFAEKHTKVWEIPENPQKYQAGKYLG